MIRLPDQAVLEELRPLGDALPSTDQLEQVVAGATGDADARATSARAVGTGYPFTSIATGGLFRVTGTAVTARGEQPWSAFVKQIQHPRHWPLIGLVPPEAADEILRLFPWQDELIVREQVLPVLPRGLRVPDLYLVADLGDDRLAVWMEDIDVDDDPWALADYARAARLLGRLAARRTPGSPAGTVDLAPGLAVRKLVESRGPVLAGLLDDDAVWARPLVADVVDAGYRDDLRRAFVAVPGLLSEMDDLPSSLPHGDAAPVNLLRPVGDPGTLVAVDWAFGCQLPLGFDLGQLLVGESEGGRVEPGDLSALLDVILPAYADGLRDEGVDVPEATLRRGLVCSLGTRTLWGAYPFEDTEGPATEEQVAQLRLRAAFGRFVMDQVLAG